MPTPYGTRGGMVFGAEELRVLRRALALALHPMSASAEDVQDCLRLADSLDEAMRECARLRAFLVADLGRYRAALPGTAAGYLVLLEEALGAGYRPTPTISPRSGAARQPHRRRPPGPLPAPRRAGRTRPPGRPRGPCRRPPARRPGHPPPAPRPAGRPGSGGRRG
ncbi:hypothetical protein ACR6C2_26320 [Streptomyces sp. INA 01156]